MFSSLTSALSMQRKKAFFLAAFSVIGAVTFLLCSASLLVPKLRVFEDQATHVLWMGGWALGIAFSFAILAVLIKRYAEVQMIRHCDHQMGLNDRLVTAYEFERSEHPMAAAVLRQTAPTVATISAKEMYPVQAPQMAWWLVASLLVFFVLMQWNFYPTFSVFGGDPEEGLLSAPQAAALTRLLDRHDWKGADKQTKEHLKKLAEELKEKKISARRALEEIERLTQFIKARKNQLRASAKDMKRVGAALMPSELSKKFGKKLRMGEFKQSVKELKSLSKNVKDLRSVKMTNKQLEALAKAWKDAADKIGDKKLNDLMNKISKSGRKLDRLPLGKDLDDLAEALEDMADDLEEDDALDDALDDLEDLEDDIGDDDENEDEEKGGGKDFVKNKKRRKGKGKRRRRMRARAPSAGSKTVKEWMGDKNRSKSESFAEKVKTIKNPGKKFIQKIVSTNDGSRSQLKDEEVYEELKRKAQDTMFRENIPTGYRKYIIRYFESIRPGDGEDEGDESSNE